MPQQQQKRNEQSSPVGQRSSPTSSLLTRAFVFSFIAKLIVIAGNCPPLRKSELEYYAMLSKTGVHHYNGSMYHLNQDHELGYSMTKFDHDRQH